MSTQNKGRGALYGVVAFLLLLGGMVFGGQVLRSVGDQLVANGNDVKAVADQGLELERQELSAQKIELPDMAKINEQLAGGKISPADAEALRPYAGRTVTNGELAKIFGLNYLGAHLAEMPTYTELDREDPLRQTVLNGTLMKGSLLNAYGWETAANFATVKSNELIQRGNDLRTWGRVLTLLGWALLAAAVLERVQRLFSGRRATV